MGKGLNAMANMDYPQNDHKGHWGIASAIVTAVGILFSGPLAFLVVSATHPQPEWSGPAAFVSNYHPIQTVTFYFGFLLVIGSLMIMAYIHDRSRSLKSLLSLVFTAIAAGLISFNYFTEAAFVPALVRNYTPDLDPVISVFAVTSPFALFWAVEMWGYGFLGLGTLFAVDYFAAGGLERWTRFLFTANGVVSVAGALYTAFHQEWVLSVAGLVSYALWNLLYLALAIAFLLVELRRRAKERTN